MRRNNFYISFGVWLAILPYFGVPGTWKNTLVFLSGIFLIIVSLGPIILKKLQTKPKSKKKQNNVDSQNLSSQSNELRFSETPSSSQNEGTENDVVNKI